MSPLHRSIAAGDLLVGTDHDFIVNAYLALLGRWPDPAGYAHYTAAIRDQPERRPEVLRALADSEEARQPGRDGPTVAFPEGAMKPADPLQALAVALDLRTHALREETARLRAALDLLPGPESDAELRAGIEAVRREMRERLDGVLALLQRQGLVAAAAPSPAATAEERIAQALAGTMADYVGDLLAASELRFEARLRAIEARLVALGAPPA